MDHWLFGQLSIDLASARWKERVPVLFDHDAREPVGVAESLAVQPGVGLVANGYWLQNATADRILEAARQGFPWEASIEARPKTIAEVSEGMRASVNGHEINGPAAVFEDTYIRELTVCALGADDLTSTEALSASDSVAITVRPYGDNTMAETVQAAVDPAAETPPQPAPDEQGGGEAPVDEPMTLDALREAHPEIAAAIDAELAAAKAVGFQEGLQEGIKIERERAGQIQEAATAAGSVAASEAAARHIRLGTAFSKAAMEFVTLASRAKAQDAIVEASEAAAERGEDDGSEVDEPDPRERYRAEYRASKAVRAEFSSADVYAAYKLAEKAGKFKVCRNEVK